MANFFGFIYSLKASLRKTKITKRKLLFFVLLFLISFEAFLIPINTLAAPKTFSAVPRVFYVPRATAVQCTNNTCNDPVISPEQILSEFVLGGDRHRQEVLSKLRKQSSDDSLIRRKQ